MLAMKRLEYGGGDMRFAVLMTCHNRVSITRSCLRRLFASKLPRGFAFDVWLNDDGCMDGTGEYVKAEFPTVNTIKGSGCDYWCGGMRRVWNAASRHFDYDGYLWLNDDTMLNDDALEIIFERNDGESILVGAVCGKDGEATYGGEDGDGFVIPDGTWRTILQMNGNVVWVPKRVFAQLGNFPKYLTHSLGDCDYSRRAVEHDICVCLSPCFVGTCEANDRIPTWKNPTAPFAKRLRNLYSPAGGCEPLVLFRYCLKHDGWLTAIKLLIANHIRTFFPKLWL